MRHELSKHFTKAATHHAHIAEEHHGLHQLHTEHAAHHAGEGDHVKAAHHREVATHHAQLAKLHKSHADHCSAMAEAMAGSSATGEPDITTPTSKMSDVDFIKTVAGIE
jgi:hypothetical protein